MADSSIGALPLAPNMADDALLVMEQQGQARKLTGAQLKDYAKQGVELEFQEDLKASQAAADRAEDAVKAVTDLTVEARTLEDGQPASVQKTSQNGVFHLTFGLPRGPQGRQGQEGKPGQRGPKGDPGNGLTILGYYDTAAALEAAQPAPNPGDAYGVGTEAPYDIYVYDGENRAWKNNGPLSGGGGGTILPEDVVTSEGGAALEIPASFGGAPHTVAFTQEEEPPLTAEDIAYGDSDVGEALGQLFTSVGDGKRAVASAITDMGVATDQDAAFQTMADNIRQISGGADTSDATATPGDILSPKTAYTASGKVQGIIPSLAAQTITPGTADKTIAGGQYLSGTQTIRGDVNLTPANIRQGVSVFGVAGAMASEFKATLTVTADTGAVVTATCGDVEVSGLSVNGSVTLELPVEGKWTVTAVRGVAQYNSVVLDVSSSYTATLTAEVHIVRVGAVTPLIEQRRSFVAASNKNYALFGGGSVLRGSGYNTYYISSSVVDAYDKNLTHTDTNLSILRQEMAAASIGEYVLIGGGLTKPYETSYTEKTDIVDAFNASLTLSTLDKLSEKKVDLAATGIGKYALFAGGKNHQNDLSAIVDAYDNQMVKTVPTPLLSARTGLGAASNGNYALFGGGYVGGSVSSIVEAYNTSLTRSTPIILSVARTNPSAAYAGDYVLFSGGASDINMSNRTAFYNTVDAYDLFLTRTLPEVLGTPVFNQAATTLRGLALFGGGIAGYKEATTVNNAVTTYTNAIYAYDLFLTRTSPDPLSKEGIFFATSIENYALFGGGYGEYNSRNVEAYQYV